MVAWLGSAAFASVGVFASQRIQWRQVPYFGALTALAVFVSWKLSHNQDDNNEGEGKTDVASTNDLEAHDQRLNGGLQRGISDENSELCTLHFPEESCVPNGVVPGNQTERGPSLDVQHGAGNELNGRANNANFKDVRADILPSSSDHLKRENHPINNMSIPSVKVETLESPVNFREDLCPNSAEGLAPLKYATQVVQGVTDAREAPDSISTTVGDTQVDKNIDTITESDRVDANNGMSEDFSILSIKHCKSNRGSPSDDSHCDQEHKVPKEISHSFADTHDARKNLEVEINVPQQEGYHTVEDRTYHTPLCTSGFSSQGSEDWKTVVVNDAMEESLARKERYSVDENSSSFFSPEHETVKVDTRNIHCTSLPNFNTAGGKCCGAGVPDRNVNASPDMSNYHLYQESDREHFVQSPGRVKTVYRDANGPEAKASNSARHKDYADRLRSYDEYLADPGLSPTMRSQVLRARATVAMYFDDSDDDDH